ncbi:hypothetical protein Taro_043685 [Colocasia esculenta]|uniref:Uncharacterized protein n=1 Tax=Colocasia esculenta TaxID=4460 RepID=A0A843WSP8_COLES|nr:hypothetical protein [Colocasia esculenta]
MRERLPHPGVQRRSTGNPDKESFEGSSAQAEEGFSDQIRRVEILSKAIRVSEPTCGGPRCYVPGSRMVLWRLVGTSS